MEATVSKFGTMGVIGVIGSSITYLFGGWTAELVTLVIFMAIDFCMGFILAAVFKKSGKSESGALQSKAGWVGLAKKGGTLLIVLVAHRLDITLGMDFVRTMVIIGFLVNEVVSIIENAGLMGIPINPALTKAVDILKAKADKAQKEERTDKQ